MAMTPYPPPMSPLPTLMLRKMAGGSITKEEIQMFWRRKKIEEEEHLIAAEKAVARIKARTLTKEDYSRFEDFLKFTINKEINDTGSEEMDSSKELKVGIKDWWTKSKYAYLNQPVTKTLERKSAYTPNYYFYHVTPSLHTSTLGVF